MYNMFDANLDGDIEKDEMKNILKMFLDGFLYTTFKNDSPNSTESTNLNLLKN